MNIFQPTSGRAEVFGHDSHRLSPRDFTEIGYVSENQEMPEWMSVEYFLAYLKPFYPKWDDARAEELLRQFDLPRDRKLRHLSRGMRMKAALASSLAYSPRLIVLDEPFTGLDAPVRDELIEGLLESADGTTILISSHDLAEIENFASHIGYLDQGRLQFSEKMSSLAARFREIEITLQGSPVAGRLRNALVSDPSIDGVNADSNHHQDRERIAHFTLAHRSGHRQMRNAEKEDVHQHIASYGNADEQCSGCRWGRRHRRLVEAWDMRFDRQHTK
jgi:ABC-2 type transport system ATP-binding protein